MDMLSYDYMELPGFAFFNREFYKIMAAQYNITIDKNSDFVRTFQIKESNVILDIAGYSFAGSIKENFNSSTKIDFVTAITDATNGLFSISLTDTVTAGMSSGNNVYDVIMTDTSGKRTRLFQGTAGVRQGVTV